MATPIVKKMAARPPTTPPAIAPVLDFEDEEDELVVDTGAPVKSACPIHVV
jgi:hypothetical protein